MEEQNGFHPIACESCRNKKSKCDRELPVCSQCRANSTACRSPPINKRGIPSGYISIIEQRLLETELVVFELLSTIYQSHLPLEPYRCPDNDREAIGDFSVKQPKSAKIEEWKSLPLASDEQKQRWWQSRQKLMHERARPSESRGFQSSSVLEANASTYPSLQKVTSTTTFAPALIQPPLQIYDPTSSWEPFSADTDAYQNTQLEKPPQTLGQATDEFGMIIYPLESEVPMIPSDPPTTTPRQPEEPELEPGSLSAHQWRKYF